MTLDTFLQDAWNSHGDSPAEVAARLESSLHLVTAAEHIPRYASLVTHVFGEHLGQFDRGLALLALLRALPMCDDAAAGSLARSMAVLRYCDGDAGALDGLSDQDRITVLAIAAGPFAGRGEFKPAIAAYREAVALAAPALPRGGAHNRTLAVGGNNLAAALEEKADRDAEETAGMILAAENGLTYWKLAGTWLEEERAEYRLTRTLLQAGQPEAAAQAAARCIAVCEANNAPAFEQFFGHAVRALAYRAAGDAAGFQSSRARAMELYAQVPADEQHWCAAELRELGEG